MDESKPIQAAELVKDPTQIYTLQSEYVIVRDPSMMARFKNMIEAINLLAEYGWETRSISVDSAGTMYALCHNTRYKRKNDPQEHEG